MHNNRFTRWTKHNISFHFRVAAQINFHCDLQNNTSVPILMQLTFHVANLNRYTLKGGGGKDKKFQVYPQIPMLWSNIKHLI